MQALYSQVELLRRDKILRTQLLLNKLLNANTINALINLFDKYKHNLKSDSKITRYIENERKMQGLNSNNVEIISYVYGYNNKKSTLHLGIKKNSQDYLHLTIHLSPDRLDPKHTGMIHIYKDIYRAVNSKTPKRLLYSLIEVKQPTNKPDSLIFSIGDGFTTSGVQNSHIYDPELQQEMNVIITVLNLIFDEDNEYYIGNRKNNSISIKTDWVLNNIDKRTQYISRKNKGIKLGPNNSLQPPINLNNLAIQRILKTKRKSNGTRRKQKENRAIHSFQPNIQFAPQ